MKRTVSLKDPAAERIVLEQRPGNFLALRIDWSRGDSSTLRLSFTEANCIAEFVQEVAGSRLGNQNEVDEMIVPIG